MISILFNKQQRVCEMRKGIVNIRGKRRVDSGRIRDFELSPTV